MREEGIVVILCFTSGKIEFPTLMLETGKLLEKWYECTYTLWYMCIVCVHPTVVLKVMPQYPYMQGFIQRGGCPGIPPIMFPSSACYVFSSWFVCVYV